MKNFKFLVLAALLATAAAADPTDDVPHKPPVTATAFACDFGAKQQIVAVVVTYADGAVVRWDARSMHGFTVQQLMVYHDSAKDSRIYIVPCKAEPIT